jgi:hypothetical protein
MAVLAHIYTTLSHKYRDSRLDPVEYVATVKVLTPTRIEEAEDFDEGDTYFFRVVAPSADRGRDLSRAIRDTLSTGGCSHEHDCCGCASTYASVRRVGPREYKVRTRTTYNY